MEFHSFIHPSLNEHESVIAVKEFSFWYGQTPVLNRIVLNIPARHVTAFIGPSGCGKSTLLRSFNRLNDLLENIRYQGEILFQGRNIYSAQCDVTALRQRIGMVFQKSTPFPMSIFENVAFPLRIMGIRDKDYIEQVVTDSLEKAALWPEVKDKLHASAYGLSGGQQQRLCIARALAGSPQVILMDEPCSALDPLSTLKIEELILSLKEQFTVVIVTHSMSQAKRISNYTCFFQDSHLIEAGPTAEMFESPQVKMTHDYINGIYG